MKAEPTNCCKIHNWNDVLHKKIDNEPGYKIEADVICLLRSCRDSVSCSLSEHEMNQENYNIIFKFFALSLTYLLVPGLSQTKSLKRIFYGPLMVVNSTGLSMIVTAVGKKNKDVDTVVMMMTKKTVEVKKKFGTIGHEQWD